MNGLLIIGIIVAIELAIMTITGLIGTTISIVRWLRKNRTQR